MTPPLTHYAVLGVEVDADADTIKRAFNRAAKHLHPDRNNGVELPYYRLAVEARDVLLDPQRRAAYDASLEASGPAPSRTSHREKHRRSSRSSKVHGPAPAPTGEPDMTLIPEPLRVRIAARWVENTLNAITSLLLIGTVLLPILWLVGVSFPISPWLAIGIGVVTTGAFANLATRVDATRALITWTRWEQLVEEGKARLWVIEAVERTQAGPKVALVVDPLTQERRKVELTNGEAPGWALQVENSNWEASTVKEWSRALAAAQRSIVSDRTGRPPRNR